jgi:hypothetical protein
VAVVQCTGATREQRQPRHGAHTSDLTTHASADESDADALIELRYRAHLAQQALSELFESGEISRYVFDS